MREQKLAFTMAEILLSLTIIGVVAAITLPSLTGNINERTWNTQRKALYARMSQAIALMPALNGYGILTEDESGSVTDTAAETFVTDGLSKVLKINNICDSEHLADCGIPSNIFTIRGDAVSDFTTNYNTLVGYNNMFGNNSGYYTYSQLNTKAVAFETANGESVLAYYNPYCVGADSGNYINEHYYSQMFMCANFVYDLNGNKGPNQFGKDIGYITALYPSDSVVVAPIPLSKKAGGSTQLGASKKCYNQDPESRVPNREELFAMFYNRIFINWGEATIVWSSSNISATTAWGVYLTSGDARKLERSRSSSCDAWCIKR